MSKNDHGLTEMPEDKISTISRPHLEYYIGD